MPLSTHEVEHIAKLAQLDLTPEEVELYRLQLSDILDHFLKLQNVKTSAGSDASRITRGHTALRPDAVIPGLAKDDVLQNTSEKEGGQFKVPPIFGEQDE